MCLILTDLHGLEALFDGRGKPKGNGQCLVNGPKKLHG